MEGEAYLALFVTPKSVMELEWYLWLFYGTLCIAVSREFPVLICWVLGSLALFYLIPFPCSMLLFGGYLYFHFFFLIKYYFKCESNFCMEG